MQRVVSEASSHTTENSAVGSKLLLPFEQFNEISAAMTLFGNFAQMRWAWRHEWHACSLLDLLILEMF